MCLPWPEKAIGYAPCFLSDESYGPAASSCKEQLHPASAFGAALLARIFHQGRARVGCDAVRWQDETTLRARAREAESGHKQSVRTVCA